MTVCVVYVGDLADPTFKWEGGDWNGNVPARLSPEFPPMAESYNEAFHAWVKVKGVRCEKTDFGGWVACVTKSEITEFITEVYSGSEALPGVADRLTELLAFVGTLDEDVRYGLVATEW